MATFDYDYDTSTVWLDNLTDELAFNAGSIATVRGLAPLPGRSLSAGVRVSF